MDAPPPPALGPPPLLPRNPGAPTPGTGTLSSPGTGPQGLGRWGSPGTVDDHQPQEPGLDRRSPEGRVQLHPVGHVLRVGGPAAHRLGPVPPRAGGGLRAPDAPRGNDRAPRPKSLGSWGRTGGRSRRARTRAGPGRAGPSRREPRRAGGRGRRRNKRRRRRRGRRGGGQAGGRGGGSEVTGRRAVGSGARGAGDRAENGW